jgi:predicted aconitase with swiveling domain
VTRAFPIVLKGHPGIGEAVEGPALVADDGFSARYDLDRINGTFSRPQHKLFGESYIDRIVILARAKGGVATAWMLFEMASRGMAPKALVLNFANPIIAQGAAFADVPLMDRLEGDVTKLVSTGDLVRLDPAAGTLTILAGA